MAVTGLTGMRKAFLLLLAWGFLVGISGAPAAAPSERASIRGTVTTQSGTIRLPGVEIHLYETSKGERVALVLSDESGHFQLEGLPEGSYRLQAALPGFQDWSTALSLAPGEQREVQIDLQLEPVAEQVEVVAEREESVLPKTGTSEQNVQGETLDTAPIQGQDFRDLIPLLPGVVRSADGLLSIKGGRPTQNSLVINGANVTDPATSDLGASLPADAIDTVHVLPNPYATEFGGFSSGLVQIQTVPGTNRWRFTANNFAPRFRERDGAIMGIESWTPRFGFRGPLLKERLFWAQNFNYRFVRTLVPSERLSELEADTRLESFLSFSQFDLVMSPQHQLTATFSLFPQKLDFVNLNSFNPKPVTPNLHQAGYNLALREISNLSPHLVLESLFSLTRYEIDVFGQGHQNMVLTPEVNLGNFFNTQRRDTRTLQVRQILSLQRSSPLGEHLFKIGFDWQHHRFDGFSLSRPVEVRRGDATLSERIEFTEAPEQRVRSWDLAVFLQDRWQVHPKVVLEPGIRLERNGILQQYQLAPRLGFVLELLPDRKVLLRGGAGLFYDRTPLSVAAFPFLENRLVTRFGRDGKTPLGPPLLLRNRLASDLQTPYSLTWNVELDQRLGRHFILKTNFLRRRGHHEFLLEPVLHGSLPQALLSSRGRSLYWELETTVRRSLGENHELIFSYVRSRSEQDLNSFDRFYGNFREPLLRENEYSLSDTDVPHRFLFWGTLPFLGGFDLVPLLEIRSGFPYSLVNEEQDFVGRRNRGGRFPTLASLDLSFFRIIKVKGLRARVGLKIFNLTNSFHPRDVQRNVDSPTFGTFFNSVDRALRLSFQILQ